MFPHLLRTAQRSSTRQATGDLDLNLGLDLERPTSASAAASWSRTRRACRTSTSPAGAGTTIPELELLRRDARIAPQLNEMELHPCFQQPELFRYCLDHGIQPVGYSPLGSPSRPERDRTPEDVVDTEHPVVRAVAEAHGVHPALVCLKWAVARGQVPIPFSVKPAQFTANLRAVAEDPLTPAEMEAMRSVERNSRLIKGQVLLWPGASSWLDLWDVDGTIPGLHDCRSRAPRC